MTAEQTPGTLELDDIQSGALHERPSPYVRSLSPDRFTETSWDWPAARRQAQRVYETYYALGG